MTAPKTKHDKAEYETGMVSTRFSIGDLVKHRKFGYRGVIFDIDPYFQLDDEWYAQMARSRPPKDAPWYHVLVDNAPHTTYVAERNLEADDQKVEVSHPLIGEYFNGFENGRYQRNISTN